MKISLSILVLTAILAPIHNYFTLGKEPLVLVIPLVLQLILSVFWFKKIRLWVAGKSSGLPDQKYVILSSFGAFLALTITAFDFILPYCLRREYLIDNHTVFLVVLFSLGIWALLFWASLQEKLLRFPPKAAVYWGKILPFTIAALIFGVNFFYKDSRNLTVALIFTVFILECTLAFLYNCWKYGGTQVRDPNLE